MDLMQFRKIPANDEVKLKLTDNHIIDLNDYTAEGVYIFKDLGLHLPISVANLQA